MSEPVRVERLTRRDEPEAVASLAAAFVDYPMLAMLCPDARRRPRVTAAFCKFLFRSAVRCDGAFGTHDRAAVVCSWPVGHEWATWGRTLRAGGLSFAWQLGWGGLPRLLRLEHELDAAREQHVPGPHCYVPLLGVRPDSQGRGLSRAVMRPVFEAADDARVPVYLETVPEANVAIYQKLGFELAGHRDLSCKLANWELVRRPKLSDEPQA